MFPPIFRLDAVMHHSKFEQLTSLDSAVPAVSVQVQPEQWPCAAMFPLDIPG